MKIAVIGAGITGVTTAYMLAKKGCEVTVFDPQSSAAMETSFANGGQISVSQPFPWNSPEVPLKVLKWLGKKDAPIVLKLQKDPAMWSWSLKFLLNCREQAFYTNSAKVLQLALHSKDVLNDIVAEEKIEYDQQTKGIIKLFGDEAAKNDAIRLMEWLGTQGVSQKLLSKEDCIELEPALQNATSSFMGGTYTEIDESGDAKIFSEKLVEAAKAHGTEFKFEEGVEKLELKGELITAIHTKSGKHKFDKIVLSAGSYSKFLADQINYRIPIYPVKGYSVTIPIKQSNLAPTISITDYTEHVVISRLGNSLRAAGTAEVGGYDTGSNPVREDMVLNAVSKLFPGIGDMEKAERWCGARPMTPDGVPIIGHSKYKNFYFNTGHGHLGWTLGCGSADLISDIIVGNKCKLDISDYSVDRF